MFKLKVKETWLSPLGAPSIVAELIRRPDTDVAREYLENVRWFGPTNCPLCDGGAKPVPSRAGIWRCSVDGCRREFTVRVGTIMESSKLPYHKWVLAIYLLRWFGEDISLRGLGEELDLTQKTAWMLGRRIRQAMGDDEWHHVVDMYMKDHADEAMKEAVTRVLRSGPISRDNI